MGYSIVSRMDDLGFDGADIHYLMKFYGQGGCIITDPKDNQAAAMAHLRRMEKREKLVDLLKGGDKKLIDRVIGLSRSGMDYELAQIMQKI